jgi:hypothetical protein
MQKKPYETLTKDKVTNTPFAGGGGRARREASAFTPISSDLGVTHCEIADRSGKVPEQQFFTSLWRAGT